MGCCVSNELSKELTLEEIEEYNKLTSEINEILSNKNNLDINNSDYLLKLINKISVKIANCEEIIKKIKLKRFNSKFSGDTLKFLNNNIKQLKTFNNFLNEQITENRRENLQKEETILKEFGVNTINTVNEILLTSNNRQSLSNFVYHKKNIRRNTRDDIS